MIVVGVDPGTAETAWVAYDTDDGRVVDHGKADNMSVRYTLKEDRFDHMAIEMIASYGMPVGREIFETCVWIGRFVEAFDLGHTYVRRSEVKSHLCKTQKAKDSNVRRALIDRFGPGEAKAIGNKKNPGPLYGLSGDEWSALAVAVTFADNELGVEK